MCGRYGLNVGAGDLARVYQAIGDDIDGWTPLYSIAPSTFVPMLIAVPGPPAAPDRPVPEEPAAVRRLEPAQWGFRPAWARQGGPRPINARLETVATNRMFRTAFGSHRAIIPMTGYFEWTAGPARTRIPHWIHPDSQADEGVLNAAAISTRFQADGDEIDTVALITTTATDRAGEVHDRMPVFLTEEALDEWLWPGRLDHGEGEELVQLAGAQARQVAGTLGSRRVSPRVNSVRSIDPGDPTLIEPMETLF